MAGTAGGDVAAGRGRSEVVRAHRLVGDLFTPVPGYFWRELAVTGSAAWAVLLLAAGLDGPPLLTAGLVLLAVPLWYRAG